MPERSIRLLPLAFACIVLSLSAYLTYGSVASYQEQRRAQATFKPVSAVVLTSRVRRIPGDEGSDTFRPEVKYRYEVDGQRYESDRFAFFAKGYSDYLEAKRVADRYPVGSTVTAYYDPSDPAKAVLDPHAPERSSVLLLAGILGVFWLAGFAVLAWSFWPWLRPRQPSPAPVDPRNDPSELLR
ncbi:MAG: hypothetical protein KatS3mg105_0966 [Gemmatales bacterium]|nr:MAG: hypothetical protein KatS3mg105_0966 [Gemmatales bacterium]